MSPATDSICLRISSWEGFVFDGRGGGPPREIGVPRSIITKGDEGDRPGLAVSVAEEVALRRPDVGGVAMLYASGSAPLCDIEGDRDAGYAAAAGALIPEVPRASRCRRISSSYRSRSRWAACMYSRLSCGSGSAPFRACSRAARSSPLREREPVDSSSSSADPRE